MARKIRPHSLFWYKSKARMTAANLKAAPVRKRDRERTERTILNAARVEFAKEGYAAARVDKVAQRAKLSKGMIYHYYGSKDALFIAVLEDIYQALSDANAELMLEDFEPVPGIKHLIDHTFSYFADHPEFIILVNSENAMRAQHLRKSQRIRKTFQPLSNKLRELLDRGVAQGVFRAGVDPTQLYISIVAAGYFFLSNRYTLGVVFDTDLFAQDALAERQNHIDELILGYLETR